MTTQYPGNIDNSITLPLVYDKISDVDAESVNRLRMAIIAIEQTLGINPQGMFNSNGVRGRLDNIDSYAVHTIGNETIVGNKTFNGSISINGAEYDGYVYISNTSSPYIVGRNERILLVDTRNGPITVKLPSDPFRLIHISDAGFSFDQNNLILNAPDGGTIVGLSSLIYRYKFANPTFYCPDGKNWLLVSEPWTPSVLNSGANISISNIANGPGPVTINLKDDISVNSITSKAVYDGYTFVNSSNSPYSVASTDNILLIDSSGGDITVNLPSNQHGRILKFIDIHSWSPGHGLILTPPPGGIVGPKDTSFHYANANPIFSSVDGLTWGAIYKNWAPDSVIGTNGVNIVNSYDTGLNIQLSGSKVQTNTTSGGVVVNPSLGDIYKLTASGNITNLSLNAGYTGQRFVFEFIQGSFAWTWTNTITNVKLASGTFTKTSTAFSIDTLTLCYDGTYWIEISRTQNIS